MNDYAPYKISQEIGPSWMDRTIKVTFETETPNGSASQAVYLDESERDALILVLGGVLAEHGEPEWEYGTALRTPKGVVWDEEPEFDRESAEEHVRECAAGGHEDNHDNDVCVVVRRVSESVPGPWLPVEDPS